MSGEHLCENCLPVNNCTNLLIEHNPVDDLTALVEPYWERIPQVEFIGTVQLPGHRSNNPRLRQVATASTNRSSRLYLITLT